MSASYYVNIYVNIIMSRFKLETGYWVIALENCHFRTIGKVRSVCTHIYSMVPQKVCVMSLSLIDSLHSPKSVNLICPEKRR